MNRAQIRAPAPFRPLFLPYLAAEAAEYLDKWVSGELYLYLYVTVFPTAEEENY